MVFLLVDGDYLLSGFKPQSDADVRQVVERLEAALSTQLLAADGAATHSGPRPRIDIRVALFSSALINSLSSTQRQHVISSLRKLRFQTTVLESVYGRSGSPVDAALCTKAIQFAMMPGALSAGSDGSSAEAARQLFCFVTPNAYIASALDLITTRGCDAVFVTYETDEVAEELLGYVSSSYGSGIATMPKKEGVAFIPNTEAASAALAALQQEGKDLPLSVLKELKFMQESLTTRRRPLSAEKMSMIKSSKLAPQPDGAVGGSGDQQAAVLSGDSRKAQKQQSEFTPPPPLPGIPSPFEEQEEEEESPMAPVTPYVYREDDAAAPTTATPSTMASAKKNAESSPASSPTAPPLPKQPTSDVCDLFAAPSAPPGADSSTSSRRSAGGVFGAATVTLTTASSPMSIVKSASAPSAAPPSSRHALVNTPPADVLGEPSVATDLPANWALMYDKQRRRHYYAYADSQGRMRSTWQHPLGPEQQEELDADVDAWYKAEAKQQQQQQQQSTKPQQPSAPSPQLQADDGALPAGWEERIDPRSGRKFYVNHSTRETTWTAPIAGSKAGAVPAPAPSPPAVGGGGGTGSDDALPPFWVAKVDPRNGRTYYANHQTRETTWTKPSRIATGDSTAPGQPPQQQQQQQQQPSSPQADKWEERVDQKTGRTFYVNHATKQTSWTKPSVAAGGVDGSAAPSQSSWEARVDPRSGRTYYVNHATKQTSWTKPS